jgi:hypothetical protein
MQFSSDTMIPFYSLNHAFHLEHHGALTFASLIKFFGANARVNAFLPRFNDILTWD